MPQAGQINVHDHKTAKHDEQQHMDRVDYAHAAQRFDDR